MTTNDPRSLRRAQQAIESGQWRPISDPVVVDTPQGYAVVSYRNGDLVETVTFNREGLVIALAN